MVYLKNGTVNLELVNNNKKQCIKYKISKVENYWIQFLEQVFREFEQLKFI